MDWFTSDWHLGHTNSIKLGNRPFSTIEEMDKGIKATFFSKVHKGDNIYFLGDMGFSIEATQLFLDEVNKHKLNFYWILGNHDKKLQPCKRFIKQCKEITTSKVIKRDKTKIYMSHYPHLTWEGSLSNSFHLYGHIHKNSFERTELEELMLGKTLNVNLEFNNFKPWNLDDIFTYMKTRPSNWDKRLFDKELSMNEIINIDYAKAVAKERAIQEINETILIGCPNYEFSHQLSLADKKEIYNMLLKKGYNAGVDKDYTMLAIHFDD